MKLFELNGGQKELVLDTLLDNQYLYEAFKWEHKSNPDIEFNTEWIANYVTKREWEFENLA